MAWGFAHNLTNRLCVFISTSLFLPVFRLLNDDRLKILGHDETTVAVLRLFEVLPDHPMITLALATKRLKANRITALRAIYALEKAKVLYEITGKSRNRVYAYHKYLVVEDTELMDPA